MSEIAERDVASVDRGDVQYQENGLDLDETMPYERWLEIGQTIGMLYRASSWFIGDWILFGEHKYGEMYSQAVNDLGLDYKTCVNTAYVCRHVPKSRRRTDLSFTHHAEVAAIKTPNEQRRMLKLAADNNWTKQELREAIKNGGMLPPPSEQPDWNGNSGIHPGGDDSPFADRGRDEEHEAAQAESPGQQIPGAGRPVIGEVLLPPSDQAGYIPESVDEVYLSLRAVADAAITVVHERGRKGLGELRQRLVAAGYDL